MKALLGGLALASALLLAVPASAESFDLNSIVSATNADLTAAKADADARGDTLASQCYAGVETYLASNPLPDLSLPAPVGVVSAFQGARDGVKNAQGLKSRFSAGIPVTLEQACGPLALDVQSDLGKAAADFTFLGIHF